MDSESYDFTDHSFYPTSLVTITDDLISEEGAIHSANGRQVDDSGQLYTQVTIETLPDDILLKIFKFFVDRMYCDYDTPRKWHTLVHICRRWRSLAFTSPRHLNLQLVFSPCNRSLEKLLDIWPELPIYVDANIFLDDTEEIRDDVVRALGLNHRVSGIHFVHISDLGWEMIAPLMLHSFPVLTCLWVEWCHLPFHRSFLGGSAPPLKVLHLSHVPYPELPELLLSSTNLVRLCYDEVPRSGYISPQAMATGLSALTRLESLSLTFPSLYPLPDRLIQIPPPHTRILLPALTDLRFQGYSEYMDDLVAQIEAPSLEEMEFWFFRREVLQVSELAKFVRRADKLSLVDRAEVTFWEDEIHVALPAKERLDRKTLTLYLACPESDLRLSYFAQFCASCLPTLSPFKVLHLGVPSFLNWEDVIDNPDPQWLDLLCLFNLVEDLRLSRPVPSRVSKALRGVPAERVAEVLPGMKNIFISSLKPYGPVWEAISEFADARQLSGHPVSVYDWNAPY